MKNFETFVQSAESWDAFLEYKLSGEHTPDWEKKIFSEYVKSKQYLEDVSDFLEGVPFPDPVVKMLNKHNNSKKRVVFTFSENKNIFLKFVSFYLMNYDRVFSDNLCSFRKNICVKTAVRKLVSTPGISEMYCYKADISDYFGSVNPQILLPQLKSVLHEDERLFCFIEGLLMNSCAQKDGETVEVKKGIMAGVPLSAFLANIYLAEMDWYFERENIIYIRYSDDIIVFAETPGKINDCKKYIENFLGSKELKINRNKEACVMPGEWWEFLGFSYHNGVVDISETSLNKMKKKMKRKARALVRWKERKNADSNRAVRAFIKAFNRKLFTGVSDNNITWSRWYFPVINTTQSLHALDLYMQDCIRYIAQGNYSKSRFNLRYSDMKTLGYTSLVNKFYKYEKSWKTK